MTVITERNRSIDVLDVLEEWIMINGKPKRNMHDNGKQLTSNMFKRFLEHNDIKDKPIPNSYPQLAGKIEAYFFLPHHALNILNQIMQQPVVQPIPFEMRQFA